ncbi:MAG: protein kinase domain-containing protein [Planctomycetota bacterium]
MSEAIPETVGGYQVDREIGRGGMGVVYLGHDPKLDRPIAIKALTADLAEVPERLARFDREARVLASLSHGNIATVYGVEEMDGCRYLIMEFVQGETLGDRLADGPLPLSEALTVCAQIAAGVEAAHEAGVVHRDLKPGNVIVQPEGTVKVLDFGLAREVESRSSRSTLVQAATAPLETVTQEGKSIGTPGYMSPEQVRGMSVDKRTDNFAFGCVLYECLAGRRAFGGQTTTDSTAAILEREPDWSALPAATPPTIQLLLRRCLQKDRRRRLRDIGDARIELDQAIDDPTSTSLGLAGAALATAKVEPWWTRWSTVLPWAVACALAVGLIALWVTARPEPAPLRKLTVTIPREQSIPLGVGYQTLAISPDGKRMAFTGRGTAWQQLYVRPLDQPEAIALPNTTGAVYPFFSPDSEWLGYANGGKLMKMSMRGGPPTTICAAPAFFGGTWGEDGTIVFASEGNGGLSRVSAAGGTPEALTTTDSASMSHRHPSFLPEGKGLTFTAVGVEDAGNWDNAAVMLYSFETGQTEELIKGGSYAQYVTTGHLLYHRENTLMAAPFDLDKLEVSGPAVPVIEGISGRRARSAAHYDVADDGTLVYIAGSADIEESLLWVDRRGKTEPLSTLRRDYAGHALAPDDGRVAVTVRDASDQDIWILERERDLLRRLTFDEGEDSAAVWSPDGDWIAFASAAHGGKQNLYRVRSDFSGDPQRLTTSPHEHAPQAWSPDGSALIFMEFHPETNGDLQVLRFDDEGRVAGEPEVLTAKPAWEWGAEFSPDGRWIAYSSQESGEREVYVRPSTGPGPAVQVSTDSGWLARWSPSGQELIYAKSLSPPVEFFTVAYSVEDDRFKPELPTALFTLNTTHIVWWFDVSADGQRLSIIGGPDEEEHLRHPRIVLNWFEELKGKAGAR